ncbi:MAG: hypothetical protein C9356_19940 [Oleiphilus sp.]|nr:MAG: hypothetical protein C9356_19940 [Oleiphilus sp.]
MKKQKLALLIGLSSALFLTACGGSSSSSNNEAVSNKVVRGSIDGFGSVIVNGVRYNTDSTQFSVNESAGIQADLKVGQVITLYGNANGNNGVASNIIYELDLKGPITAVEGDTFTVLGQTVLTNKLTTYKDITLPLTVGASVEISGYVSGENLIASYVERNDDNDTEVELRGVIANLDESAQTFDIRGQQVDYIQSTELDLDGQVLANGLRVEVEGTLENGVLVATEIEADEETFAKDTELELLGIVSELDAEAKTFIVNGTQVTWNNQTDFDDLTAAQLANDLTVELEGRVNAEGVLVAEDIEIEEDANISLEATISEVTEGSDQFSGTITVLGLQVSVDMSTRMSDDDDNPNADAKFNFSHLSSGDKVELEVTGNSENGYRAVKLERDYNDSSDNDGLNEVELELPASLIDVENKLVLGISYEASAEVSLTVLDNLEADTEVEIEGTMNGDVLTITSIEIDD